jgi:hypothetical protein
MYSALKKLQAVHAENDGCEVEMLFLKKMPFLKIFTMFH